MADKTTAADDGSMRLGDVKEGEWFVFGKLYTTIDAVCYIGDGMDRSRDPSNTVFVEPIGQGPGFWHNPDERVWLVDVTVTLRQRATTMQREPERKLMEMEHD